MNIARNALSTYELAMNVTGHNIANATTPGYTRQTAVLSSESPLTMGKLQLGMGVEVSSVTQAFDRYTNQAILQNTSVLSENEAKASALSYLEGIFNETTSYGLNQALADFWNAWQDLAGNPGGTPERTALLDKAEALCTQFNSMSRDLNQVINSMNSNLNSGISECNQITSQIAALNEKIVAAESNGSKANDLRDQRNTLLESLSKLIGNNSFENESGSVTVMTSEGILLVDGNQSWSFSRAGNQIYYNGVTTDVSQRLTGGKIGAWLDVRDEIAPQYLANLDELAGTLIEEVNTVHSAGFDLSGTTGTNFFEALSNPAVHAGSAAFIQLSADVQGNPAGIAAGGQSGSSGDNENALRMADLQTDDTISILKWSYQSRGTSNTSNPQSTSFEDFYRALVGNMGILSSGVTQNQEFAQSLLDNLTEVRDSISGVNLDEEMTELMKIQRGFEAASKLIAMADEMLQALLQIR